MFNTLIVQPIFNLLVLIYTLLPGHNFGMAIILFTIVIRLLMWPLVKKQLYHAKAMRELQPEMRRIKKLTKGDKQKESQMMMELYKERGINPFSSIGLIFVQLPIFLALYSGLRRVVVDHQAIIDFSYPALQNTSWMQELASDISKFDSTLFGIVDLSRPALGAGGIYWPAMLIVLASVFVQYHQAKQLSPNDKDAKSLRTILKDANSGKQTDSTEVNAAVAGMTRFLLPVLVFMFTVNIASALSLYWLVSGLVAYLQQAWVLRREETIMEASVDAAESAEKAAKAHEKTVLEGEIIPPKTKTKPKKKAKKRRKK